MFLASSAPAAGARRMRVGEEGLAVRRTVITLQQPNFVPFAIGKRMPRRANKLLAAIGLVAVVGVTALLAQDARERGPDAHPGGHQPGEAPPEVPAAPAPGHPEGHEPPDAQALPPGYSDVHLAADRLQLIGVRLGRVERAWLEPTVRASGVVQVDETREVRLHSRLTGWVDELFVDAVGAVVKDGAPLYSLYSPELVQTQQEYLAIRRSSPSLAAAARRRMELWDVPADQLRLIERQGLQETVVFRSPIVGIVLEKTIYARRFVEPGMTLYRIADLSVVWILADVYEFEVNTIDPSGVARFTVQGLPDRFAAQVDYVYPVVDAVSRTVRVRLIASNRDGHLRPGSFAAVELPAVQIDGLWVHEEAVIDTGVRQVVFVHLGEGHFRPVEVRIGARVRGRAQVLEGLEEGDEVAASGHFLIDSESRLDAVDHAGH